MEPTLHNSVHCGTCGAAIHAQAVYAVSSKAYCDACQAVFRLAPPQPALPDPPPRFKSTQKLVANDPGSIVKIPWFRGGAVIGLVFSVAVVGAIIAMGYVQPSREKDAAFLRFISWFLGLTLLPGFLFYGAAAWLNFTTLRISDGYLDISHGPVPLPGRRYTIAEIEGIYTCGRNLRNDPAPGINWFEVRLVLKGGRWRQIAANLLDEEALFIEQQLEQALGRERKRL